jgi:hypothetical protein
MVKLEQRVEVMLVVENHSFVKSQQLDIFVEGTPCVDSTFGISLGIEVEEMR